MIRGYMRMAVASVSTAIAMVEDQDQMFVCTIAQTRASFLCFRKSSARQPDAYCEWKTKETIKYVMYCEFEHFCCKDNRKLKYCCKIAFNMLQTSTTCVSGQQMISEQMPTLTQSSNSLHPQPKSFSCGQYGTPFAEAQLRFSFSSWRQI